jgi:diaminopimelate decarboxylase
MDSEPLKNANLIQEESKGDFKDFQKKTSKKTIYIISGIILLVVIVTVVLVVLLTKPNDEDKPKPRSLLEKLKSKKTPYYYYNTSLLNQTIDEALRLANKDNIKIHFSLKSNFNEKIVKIFASHKEIGADCVSGGEVKYALKHFPPEKIVFAGIGKTDEEIEHAINNSIFCINVESFEELERLNDICNRLNKKTNFGVRINPNIEAHTHEKIITGSNENKFGIYIDEVKDKFYNKIEEIFFHKNANYKNLNFIGLHFHIGSQILNFTDFARLCAKIDKYVDELNERNISITYLNLGGGLGVDYDEPNLNPIPDFEGFFNTYLTNLTCLQKIGPDFNGGKNITLHFELGRSMIAQSGLLISKVIYVKEGIFKKFVILDAGMNDLIRPAMYNALHQIERVEPSNEQQMYDVVGPICESSDVFAKNYTMDVVEKDDYVIIRTAGAYGESMASRYNFRELPIGYLDFEL